MLRCAWRESSHPPFFFLFFLLFLLSSTCRQGDPCSHRRLCSGEVRWESSATGRRGGLDGERGRAAASTKPKGCAGGRWAKPRQALEGSEPHGSLTHPTQRCGGTRRCCVSQWAGRALRPSSLPICFRLQKHEPQTARCREIPLPQAGSNQFCSFLFCTGS